MERFLMCPPDHFQVEYVINPWMEGNVRKSSPDEALQQWRSLSACLEKHAEIEFIQPQSGLPDMAFTANAGLVMDRRVVLSRFFHKERRGEQPHLRHWFAEREYEIFELPEDLPFEGAGDALMDRGGPWLWAAYGNRTELEVHPLLARWLGLEVFSLRLIDPRFYHLDTCFCPLEGGWLLYYPPAFDGPSNRFIEQHVAKRIAVNNADALRFACNALNIGNRVILNAASSDLKASLADAGFETIEVPLTEFMKAGGAAKCLTLRLSETTPAGAHPASSVESRILRLEGHLLDSRLLDRALSATLEAGGSFRILHFTLGKQRQSTSAAEIQVSAPSHAMLEKIFALLIDLGGVAAAEGEELAELKPVSQPGVAPEGFYGTTIYPTEVRVEGQWLPVQDQRMDGVVAVSGEGNRRTACCKLVRDLRVGDRVAVGSRGIRTARKTHPRELQRTAPGEKEFAFMEAGASSERRVDVIVEKIAWEMSRLREQRGRVIVVAGPVVIHTGGGNHLAWLIRHGYVQALLGGNAIAAHDIEQALYRTSLGVDLNRGRPVQGGHQHHLRAINTIRRSGGIRQSVEQGVLRSGVFFECIVHHVPFSLAGSIRDDGPLPDTQMDLIRAQEEYSRLIKGADLTLMLGSMLHSIGVGNMTPAGVKLVCVDINPAVVTKLSDRGSLESTGVVTDVGLFLNLLTRRLRDLG